MTQSHFLRINFAQSDVIQRGGRISSRTTELPDVRIVQVTFEPGATWSADAASFAGTALC
jgi:hypothetical protein